MNVCFPDFDRLAGIIKKEPQLVHARNMCSKIKKLLNEDSSDDSAVKVKALSGLLPEYLKFYEGQSSIIGYSDGQIIDRVGLLNAYFSFYLTDPSIKSAFKNTDKLRSSILEEFMYILFRDFVKELTERHMDCRKLLKCGAPKAYTNLFFHAKNMDEFIDSPQASVNLKDLDFSIFRKVNVTVDNTAVKSGLNVPILAVENKSYLDKTMLDSVIASAEKIKTGNPYASFFVIAECYDVSEKVDPSYSKIDQIYILRKTVGRVYSNPIVADVVLSFFHDAKAKIEKPWFDIETKLSTDGKIL